MRLVWLDLSIGSIIVVQYLISKVNNHLKGIANLPLSSLFLNLQIFIELPFAVFVTPFVTLLVITADQHFIDEVRINPNSMNQAIGQLCTLKVQNKNQSIVNLANESEFIEVTSADWKVV